MAVLSDGHELIELPEVATVATPRRAAAGGWAPWLWRNHWGGSGVSVAPVSVLAGGAQIERRRGPRVASAGPGWLNPIRRERAVGILRVGPGRDGVGSGGAEGGGGGGGAVGVGGGVRPARTGGGTGRTVGA